MKFKLTLLSLGLCLCSSPLWAVQGTGTGYVGFSPMSAYAPHFVAPPVEAGFYLGESWSLGVEYGQSQFNFGHVEAEEVYHQGMMSGGWGGMTNERWESQDSNFPLPADATSTGSHYSYAVKARWYVAEHLNFQIALIDKQTYGTVEVPINLTGATSKGNFNAHNQLSTIGVGSLWHNEMGMIFGVDWAIGANSLNQSVNVKMQENPAVSTAEQETTKLQIEDFGNSLNQFLARSGGLNVFVGWQF